MLAIRLPDEIEKRLVSLAVKAGRTKSFYAREAIHIHPGETILHGLIILILSNYIYKVVSALIDTVPFYIGVKYLSRYLQLNPEKEWKEKEK